MYLSDFYFQGSHGGSPGTQLYAGFSPSEKGFGPNFRAVISISDVKAILAFEDAFADPA